jgi:hypothetical protein
MRILNHPATLSEQAEFLGQQFGEGGFDRYYERQFVNLCRRTWAALVEQHGTAKDDFSTIVCPTRLVVHQGGEAIAIAIAPSESALAEPIYVRDNNDETAVSLIEAIGKPFFDPDIAKPSSTGRLMRALYGQAVKLLSEVDYEMQAGDKGIGEGNVALAVERCPWLKVATAVAMEALRGTELQRLPADRSVVMRGSSGSLFS